MSRDFPGGISRIRALRVVVSAGPRLLLPGWLRRLGMPLAAGVTAVAVTVTAVVLFGQALRIELGGFLLVSVALAAVVSAVLLRSAGSGRSLYRLPRDEHADLHDLVAEVADALGVRRPGRVYAWAYHDSVAVRALPRRDELHLGLPYLTEMSRDELKAAVAHELALLRQLRSWPMRALYTLWQRDVRECRTPPAEVRRPVESMIHVADAAGVRVAGLQATVSALYRGTLIAQSFIWFTFRYAWPLTGVKGYPPDLYRGWRWKVRQDELLQRFAQHIGRDARPGDLTDRIAALGGECDNVFPDPGPALLTGLPADVESAFARSYLREQLPGGHTAARAISFGDVPEEVWDGVLEQQLTELCAAVAARAGISEATPRDVLDLVVAGRVDEIWDHHGRSCLHPGPAVCALVPVLHHELRARGYRRGHPLRQRVLTRGDGEEAETVDVVALAERVAVGGQLPAGNQSG
ncbi:hypothetical protein HS041_18265 [Planomonospora sp. ID67723]|uniref:M48 family metallopeptidase n=1 Tax=Planomonospora sp. ID67723 TaxID=2738134 RepID=UPI0018C37CB8|nr:M48 family metallopeptidase [Planomonospora sp. ID67723]MBG0829711.1 hypothetical protein [Planomonospora sp. ID67723]